MVADVVMDETVVATMDVVNTIVDAVVMIMDEVDMIVAMK